VSIFGPISPENYEWLVLAWASGDEFERAFSVFWPDPDTPAGREARKLWTTLDQMLKRWPELSADFPFDLPG